MRLQCDQIFIVVFFSHDIAFQSGFAEVLMFMKNVNKMTLNSYFKKFYWNFDTFILTTIRCEAQRARFWRSGAEFPRAYARMPKPVSTGVENGLSTGLAF